MRPRLRSAHRSPVAGAAAGPRTVCPLTSDGLRLVVPPAEQAVAERRGARFDSASGDWTVPAGRPVAVHAFHRWRPARWSSTTAPASRSASWPSPMPATAAG
jgi:hypothetical protein